MAVQAMLAALGSTEKVSGYIGGHIAHEQSQEALSPAIASIGDIDWALNQEQILQEAYAEDDAWIAQMIIDTDKAQEKAAKKAPRTRRLSEKQALKEAYKA